MCLITYTPDKTLLNLENLKVGMENNPHGFGVVYADKGSLQICRKMDGWDYFLEVLKLVPVKTPMAIHFRWATQGDKVVENTHPFRISAKEAGHTMDLCMMHNGTIPGSIVGHGYNSDSHGWSDTRKYVVHHLRPFLQKYPEAVFDPVFIKMIERDVGTNSKLLFLSGDGRVSIINKQQGDIPKEHPDMWYSNLYSFNENHRGSKKNTTTTTTSTEHGDNIRVRSVVKNIHQADPEAYKIQEIPGDSELEHKGDMPEYLKKMLGPLEDLLKRSNMGTQLEIRGYGWVHNGTTITHRMPVALAHRRWDNTRRALKTQLELPKLESIVSEKLDKTSDLINSMSQKFDTIDFRTMNPSELLQWVSDYPERASQWMSTNGFFASAKQIQDRIKFNEGDFTDVASEFIFKKSRDSSYVPPIEHYNQYKFDVV